MIGSIRQIDRQQLAALLARSRARRIASVHVHHTWRPAHADWRDQATIETIRRFHVDVLGWSDIGQHLTIGPDGSLWTGRDLDQPPASAAGHNGSAQEGALMIALVGDFNLGHDPFTGAQADETYATVALALTTFNLPTEAIRFSRNSSARCSSKSMAGARADAALPVLAA